MENNQTKICTKCKVGQDLSCFGKKTSASDGLAHRCRKCVREYRQSNKEHIQEYYKSYYYNNQAQIKATRDDNNAYYKNYYQSNKKTIIEKSKEYQKKYNEINRDIILAKRRLYNQKKKKERLEYDKKYRQTPEGKISSKNRNHKRRSITRNGDVTTLQLMELEQNAKVCYWCNISLKKVKVHIDHYVPLSKGGSHTLSNLVVSCPKCNQTKSAKDPLDFAQSLGKLL